MGPSRVPSAGEVDAVGASDATVPAGAASASLGREAIDGEIMELLFEVVGVMKAHFLACIGEVGLSPAQAHALRRLEPDRPLPMRDLAAELRCDASTVTGLVDRLEDRGLVERRAPQGDRRIKAVALTERGHDVRSQLIETLSRRLPEIIPLDDGERVELRDALRRIVVARRPGVPAG
jgi:DNA-binding MarR family transcriptional regulator